MKVCECPGCGSTTDVQEESGRTAYHFTGVKGSPEDPNRSIWLCRDCAKDHHQYWDEMWENARPQM
jgi:hypothetical protein